MDIEKEVLCAAQRLQGHISHTPLLYSPVFSQLTAGEVYFKLENLQHTGSFKVRGAINKLLTLSSDQRRRGVVAASSGNHGTAVAYGLAQLGMTGIIFVPTTASPAKVEAIQRLGAEVRFYSHDSGLTEIYARDYAEKQGMVYVSPYNDPLVVAGQGTIGLEIAQQLEQVDAVFVSLGGGGLVGGVAGYLKQVRSAVRVVAASPENSSVMAASVAAGHILALESLPTLSDGTAGGVEPDAITFALCRDYVDHFPLVTEADIRAAMVQFMDVHHLLIEGAAGVAIAALLQMKTALPGQRVVVVICGANISLPTLRSVLADS